MKIVDIGAVLKNITGFAAGNPGKIEQRHNEIWHWFKHCFGFLGDIPHILTVQDYLKLGREVGMKAAQNAPGTYTKLRNTDEILVYWEPKPGQHGLFMIVRPSGPRSGEITTLFSPDDNKRYYDLQAPIGATFH
jgi:hypothetical protein